MKVTQQFTKKYDAMYNFIKLFSINNQHFLQSYFQFFLDVDVGEI